MRARRRSDDLCSGPGKLTQALGIGLEMNGTALASGPGAVEPPVDPLPAVAGTRIGITKGVELPWRFCAVGARTVSRPWPPGLLAA